MKNLKEEIQRSKQLMGIAEGLNLQKKQSPQSWFRTILKQITGPHTPPNAPHLWLYTLDDKIMFEYNRKNGNLLVDTDRIWSVFRDRFDMQSEEIADLIKFMVEEHYKLESVTPIQDWFA